MNKNPSGGQNVPSTARKPTHWWYDRRQTGVYNSSPPMPPIFPHGITEKELHMQASSPPKGSTPSRPPGAG